MRRSSFCRSPLTSCGRTPKYLKRWLLCQQGSYFFLQNDNLTQSKKMLMSEYMSVIELNNKLITLVSISHHHPFRTVYSLKQRQFASKPNSTCSVSAYFALRLNIMRWWASVPQSFLFFLNSFGQSAVTHWWIINREQNMFEDNWKMCHGIKTLLEADCKRSLQEFHHGHFWWIRQLSLQSIQNRKWSTGCRWFSFLQ